MKIFRTISRYLVGIVFIFSGFVKGVDPLGTAYRIEDYFYAYGTDWAIPLALFLSISLCTLEFVLGASLILNSRLKELSWILFFLMIFFTGLTLYDAVFEPVPDCGCFGDAVKLTNWGTFYKNVVLILFVGVIFFGRKTIKSPFKQWIQNILVISVIIAFGGFSLYQYRHIPMADFRDWKVGKDMAPDDMGEAKIYLSYKNIKTGEVKEYLSPNYPWNDSVWMTQWEFVNQRIDDSEIIRPHQLQIVDFEGNDYTFDFVENSDYQLIVVAWNLDETALNAFPVLSTLYDKVDEKGYLMIAVTSGIPEKVEAFKQINGVKFDFFNADDVVLKSMIRSNPGLILMKDGVVMGKWAYRDFLTYEQLHTKFNDF